MAPDPGVEHPPFMESDLIMDEEETESRIADGPINLEALEPFITNFVGLAGMCRLVASWLYHLQRFADGALPEDIERAAEDTITEGLCVLLERKFDPDRLRGYMEEGQSGDRWRPPKFYWQLMQTPSTARTLKRLCRKDRRCEFLLAFNQDLLALERRERHNWRISADSELGRITSNFTIFCHAIGDVVRDFLLEGLLHFLPKWRPDLIGCHRLSQVLYKYVREERGDHKVADLSLRFAGLGEFPALHRALTTLQRRDHIKGPLIEDDVCALSEALFKVVDAFDRYQSLLYTRRRASVTPDTLATPERIREDVFPSEALDEVLDSMEAGRRISGKTPGRDIGDAECELHHAVVTLDVLHRADKDTILPLQDQLDSARRGQSLALDDAEGVDDNESDSQTITPSAVIQHVPPLPMALQASQPILDVDLAPASQAGDAGVWEKEYERMRDAPVVPPMSVIRDVAMIDALLRDFTSPYVILSPTGLSHYVELLLILTTLSPYEILVHNEEMQALAPGHAVGHSRALPGHWTVQGAYDEDDEDNVLDDNEFDDEEDDDEPDDDRYQHGNLDYVFGEERGSLEEQEEEAYAAPPPPISGAGKYVGYSPPHYVTGVAARRLIGDERDVRSRSATENDDEEEEEEEEDSLAASAPSFASSMSASRITEESWENSIWPTGGGDVLQQAIPYVEDNIKGREEEEEEEEEEESRTGDDEKTMENETTEEFLWGPPETFTYPYSQISPPSTLPTEQQHHSGMEFQSAKWPQPEAEQAQLFGSSHVFSMYSQPFGSPIDQSIPGRPSPAGFSPPEFDEVPATRSFYNVFPAAPEEEDAISGTSHKRPRSAAPDNVTQYLSDSAYQIPELKSLKIDPDANAMANNEDLGCKDWNDVQTETTTIADRLADMKSTVEADVFLDPHQQRVLGLPENRTKRRKAAATRKRYRALQREIKVYRQAARRDLFEIYSVVRNPLILSPTCYISHLLPLTSTLMGASAVLSFLENQVIFHNDDDSDPVLALTPAVLTALAKRCEVLTLLHRCFERSHDCMGPRGGAETTASSAEYNRLQHMSQVDRSLLRRQFELILQYCRPPYTPSFATALLRLLQDLTLAQRPLDFAEAINAPIVNLISQTLGHISRCWAPRQPPPEIAADIAILQEHLEQIQRSTS